MQPFMHSPGAHRPDAPRPVRPAWVAGGIACIVLSTLGIVLPLLPTVDFYVLAAICFARGNPRLEARLLPARTAWIPSAVCALVALYL